MRRGGRRPRRGSRGGRERSGAVGVVMVLTTACCELALACQHLLPVRRSLQRTLAAFRDSDEVKTRWQKKNLEGLPGGVGLVLGGAGGAQGHRGSVVGLLAHRLPPRDTGRTTTPVEVEEDVHDHRDVRRGGRGVGACGGPAASHGFASVFRGRVDGSTRLALPHSGAPRLEEGVQLKAYVARLNFPTIRETS